MTEDIIKKITTAESFFAEVNTPDTILPIIFMILVAFTNYDNQHQPPQKLFTWVGVKNFQTLLSSDTNNLGIDLQDKGNGITTLTITAKNGDIITVDTTDANALRQMGDMLRDKNANIVAVLSAVNGEKITFLAVCGKEAVAKGVKAGDIIKTITPICGGKGGGKPDSAMGGGSDVTKLNDALAAVDTFVASKLGL